MNVRDYVLKVCVRRMTVDEIVAGVRAAGYRPAFSDWDREPSVCHTVVAYRGIYELLKRGKLVNYGSAYMREIEFGEAMADAFRAGVTEYVPTCKGKKLKPECKSLDNTKDNLVLLVEEFGNPTDIVCEGNNVLIIWADQSCYLATGFDYGVKNDASRAFAQFATDAGFVVVFEDALRKVEEFPPCPKGLGLMFAKVR